MNKLIKLLLPFLLFTLISNTTFATVSHEGKESKEVSYSARKLGLQSKEGLAKLTKEFRELVGNQAGNSRLHEPFVDMLENLAKKGYRKADPSRVVNATKDYVGKTYQIGSHQLGLNRTKMKHILERHHPDFWNGTIKNNQSFFPKNTSFQKIENSLSKVITQNRDKIISKGTNSTYQLRGNVDGVDYVLGINKGQIGQFYPVKK